MQHYLVFSGLITLFLLIVYGLSQKFVFFRKLLIANYLVTMLIYIGWRIGFTIPTNNTISFILGMALLIAEVGGFLLSTVFYFLFFRENKNEKKTLQALQGDYPTIDVFIATYNEDLLILKRAIIAAKNMRYPEPDRVKIYVLDDGSRSAVADLAETLNVHYLKRDTHEHAKAGNLNHGVGQTNGELIVTLDADMVPRIDFLEGMIGYFAEKKMGFVQAPQTFFNEDPYQFNLYAGEYLNNDQDFFMRSIEEQKDIYNAVMYVGSNAVFRRTCLADIGGFATGVITEDMATGMFVQAKGWQTRFVNENLASGLAPETFGDLIKQRDRWCRGNIQVARKWNPLRVKGLTPVQKILYLDGIHYWFSGLYKMIYLLAPIFFLLLGFYSLDANFQGILYFWLPAFLASQFAFNRISQGKQTVLVTNVYETVMAPFMAYAVIGEAVFKAKNKFVVTNKGKNSNKPYYNWKIAAPIVVLWLLSLFSLIKSLLILTDVLPFGETKQAIYINFFWLFYNIIALSFAALLTVERPRFRRAERFFDKEAIVLFNQRNEQIAAGHLLDWNELSGRVQLKEWQAAALQEGAVVKMTIAKLEFPGKVVRVEHKDDTCLLSLVFEDLSEPAYAYIIERTYAKKSGNIPTEEKKNAIGLVLYAILRHQFQQAKKVFSISKREP